MILRAYMCDGGVLHERQDEGASTLFQIFLQRPDDCRYAILEVPSDGFLSVDLFDLRQSSYHDLHLGAHTRHETYDAAIVATAIRYSN